MSFDVYHQPLVAKHGAEQPTTMGGGTPHPTLLDPDSVVAKTDQFDVYGVMHFILPKSNWVPFCERHAIH